MYVVCMPSLPFVSMATEDLSRITFQQRLLLAWRNASSLTKSARFRFINLPRIRSSQFYIPRYVRIIFASFLRPFHPVYYSKLYSYSVGIRWLCDNLHFVSRRLDIGISCTFLLVNKSLKGNWEIEKASFASYYRRDEICDHGSTTQRCPNTSGSRHPSPSNQPPVDPVEVNKVFSSFFFQLLASLFHHPSVLHVLGWFVPFGSISVFFHMLASFLLYILYYPSLGLHISQ